MTFLGVGITSSHITPPQMKIRQDIKTLQDMQRLVGSSQWLHNIVLIPPEALDPLNDLLKGKNPWEQKTLTLEAISSLNCIKHQMSVSTLNRWDSSTLVHLYVHFTKKGGVGALAQGPPRQSPTDIMGGLGETVTCLFPGSQVPQKPHHERQETRPKNSGH